MTQFLQKPDSWHSVTAFTLTLMQRRVTFGSLTQQNTAGA